MIDPFSTIEKKLIYTIESNDLHGLRQFRYSQIVHVAKHQKQLVDWEKVGDEMENHLNFIINEHEDKNESRYE